MKTKSYSQAVLNLAAVSGIPATDLPLIINGCSGGFSTVYVVMFGRTPSCEGCCDLHDLRYQLGGNAADRKTADVELRECAMLAGSFPPGLTGTVRRFWRWCRAWVMYGAVRLFGGRYWSMYAV